MNISYFHVINFNLWWKSEYNYVKMFVVEIEFQDNIISICYNTGMAEPMVGSTDFKSVGGSANRPAVGSIPTHSRHIQYYFKATHSKTSKKEWGFFM